MNKRIISLCLCFVALWAASLPVYADEEPAQEAVMELKISTAEELLAFAEDCRLDSYSQSLTVYLENDIDLSGTSFEPIPVFSGTFDGKGNRISGLSVTADGSVQGLFRYLTASAVVRELSVSGQLHPGGSRNTVGGIAGHNEGTIINCAFSGSISGADHVGGLVGINAVTGIIENCHTEGQLHADHFVGGIAGSNYGVIRSCSNKAAINTTPQQNDVAVSDITMDTLTNTEAANTVTDIGGIVGISSGVIRDCTNLGDVGYRHMGYNIGGIAGTQSGYLVACRNQGSIQGRKEVGGIVGQMEPTTLIAYSEDTLQILQGQLDELSGLANQASGTAQANAEQIGIQIGVLQDQAQTARDAVDSLIPDEENPEPPDPDTILAAQNTLFATLEAMPETLDSLAAATQTTVDGLSKDLGSISAQINAMGATVNGASESLGGSIIDASDRDTPEMLTGKVEGCVNYGDILADLNAGGIAGAMAMENDLDIFEDWEQYGEESLNFQSEVRAVLLGCENQGTVTVKKQNAGGIVGWQWLGLVKSCTNTGKIDCADADYVGGIAGLSAGYIRGNYAKCEINASTYAGGIAGSGSIVTDCLAQVKLVGGKEKLGAILGSAEDSNEEAPIGGNYYLCVDKDYGAIDGISYSGLAEAREPDAFLSIEGIPEIFETVTVCFVFEDGETVEIPVALGGALKSGDIPAVAQKDGCTGKWDGLETAQLTSVMFDMTFRAVYTAQGSTIASAQTRENGLPVLLVEGAFTDEAVVVAEKLNNVPALEKEKLLEAWTVNISESGDTARFLLPDGVKADEVKLLICGADDKWREASFTQDGSYLVFKWNAGDKQLALVQQNSNFAVWLIVGTVIVAAAVTAVLVIRKKKKAASKT